MQTHQQKKQTGAFYTPSTLAQRLAREVLDAAAQSNPAVKWNTLKILDPAAGEGGLLLPFAQELAQRRRIQEPEKTQAEVLQDIFDRQLVAADIDGQALARYTDRARQLSQKQVRPVCYHGDALAEKNAQSVLQPWGPFDLIVANPPYVGQKGHAEIFKALRQNPLWADYVVPKNDLLYYFFYLALHLLKPGGVAGFITPPYFATAAGGKRLRKTLQEQSTLLRLIDFEQHRLFAEAAEHTLLSVFQSGTAAAPCQVGNTKINVAQKDLFYGPDLFLRTQPPGPEEELLKRMQQAPHRLGEIAQVSTGLMTGCDRAFVLSSAEKNRGLFTQKELAKLKPFFKNSDIKPYAPCLCAKRWLIDFFYPNDRDTDITLYPHLLAHLSRFKHKLLLRKQNNNGIDKQLAQGRFWFGSVRRKINFEAEKLVLPHRAKTVCAAYSNGPWYASSDVYFITNPQAPYTLWTLLGLLNSAPYFTWLKANGKRKGELLELYSAPLLQLPIPTLPPQKKEQLEKLTRMIYKQKQAKNAASVLNLQEQIDKLVSSCF